MLVEAVIILRRCPVTRLKFHSGILVVASLVRRLRTPLLTVVTVVVMMVDCSKISVFKEGKRQFLFFTLIFTS